MQATGNSLTELIDGKLQYLIPVFQRDYSWSAEQCEQLWQDVLAVADASSDARHFLGSIVYAPADDAGAALPRWLLIDGQQRFTTVVLLVAALRDHVTRSEYEDAYLTRDDLDRQFLRNPTLPDTHRPKLVLRRHDHATLTAILDENERPSTASARIRENYSYFKGRMADVDPMRIYRGINRLEVVDVKLHSHDDPQAIFESLNSTGVDLSPSDLIRNFVLMRLPEQEQTRLYEQYWHKIELLFRGHGHRSNNFFRDYVALKTSATKQGRAGEIYHAFRRVFDTLRIEAGDLEQALVEMLRYARYYAAFSLNRGIIDEDLRPPLRRLRRLVDVPAILVMRLYDCHARLKTLETAEFIEALVLLESYVFRRAICGLQTRGYWSTFARLAHQIDDMEPLNSLKVGLARQSRNYRFPQDQEFDTQLREQNIYGKRVCRVLLERLENHDQKEVTDTSRYSIEHIIPQNERLSSAWQEMLGLDWKGIQEEWLHRLGNLTLTGYNSEMSDRPFEDKKTTKRGFEESAVRLNLFVRKQSVWTAAQMEERGTTLAQKSLVIWPQLKVETALLEKAKREELLKRSKRGSVEKVKMDKHARQLHEVVREEVKQLDSTIVEIAEGKSISYHAQEFFVEVLPRVQRLLLLMAPEFNEIEDDDGIAENARRWKFLVGSRYDGGVLVNIKRRGDVGPAMRLVRQALELEGR